MKELKKCITLCDVKKLKLNEDYSNYQQGLVHYFDIKAFT